MSHSSHPLSSWLWFSRTGMFYYFFLDYRRPHAVFAYLGLFATLLVFYGLSYLIAGIARQETERWWTYPCILLATFCITRFRPPAAVKAKPLTP